MSPTCTSPSIVLLALTLTLAACIPEPAIQLPDAPPTVRGTLAEVRHSATASGLSVDGGEACGMVATADAETRVLRRGADGVLRLVGDGAPAVGALEVGQTVAVWADGPVMESCPVQGRAGTVVVEVVTEADLVGRWVHAAEEDADGIEVYRRGEAEDFPPRMYRQRYALLRGGRAEALVPHPADAHYLAAGSWSLDGDVLTVRYEGHVDRLRVVGVVGDALRVVREG
jgi:hypothetical protein